MKTLAILLTVILLASCSDSEVKGQTENNLIGTWELKKYEGGTDTLLTPPENAEPILISFTENEFNGNTGRNDFFGSYNIKASILVFLQFGITEINETTWGLKFSNSLVKTFNNTTENYEIPFLIDGENLRFEYIEGLFMYFEK